MNLWLAIGTVFAFGVVQFWLAIPAGFAFGLNPAATCITTMAGSITGVLIALIPGERIGAWLARRKKDKPGPKGPGRAMLIWKKYGLVGLAFFSPIFPGAPVGALVALSLGSPKLKTLAWFSLSVIVWSVGVTLAGLAGLAALGAL